MEDKPGDRNIFDNFLWKKKIRPRKDGSGDMDVYVEPPGWFPKPPKPYYFRSHRELSLYLKEHNLFHKINLLQSTVPRTLARQIRKARRFIVTHSKAK